MWRAGDAWLSAITVTVGTVCGLWCDGEGDGEVMRDMDDASREGYALCAMVCLELAHLGTDVVEGHRGVFARFLEAVHVVFTSFGVAGGDEERWWW